MWVADPFLFITEAIEFDPPTIADPTVGGTIFVGAEHVWRTQDSGGDRKFLEKHCNTTGQFGTSDQLFTGNCGDFEPIGPSLTDPSFGDRAGGDLLALGRGTDKEHAVGGDEHRPRVRVEQRAGRARQT